MGYPDGIISQYDLDRLKERLRTAEAIVTQIREWAAAVETTDDYADFADDVIRLVES